MEATKTEKDMIRTFWAFELSREVRTAVAEIINDLKTHLEDPAVRWMMPEKLHITMRFLGKTSRADIEPMCFAVQEALQKQKAIQISWSEQVMIFPTDYQPYILALDMEPKSVLYNLVQRLEPTFTQFGFATEPKPFKPHVTLARLNHAEIPEFIKALSFNLPTLCVEEIVLLQSQPSSADIPYQTLGRARLSG